MAKDRSQKRYKHRMIRRFEKSIAMSLLIMSLAWVIYDGFVVFQEVALAAMK